MIRRNRILNTDSTPPTAPGIAPIRAIQGTSPAVAASAAERSTSLSNRQAPMAGTGDGVIGVSAFALSNSEISDNLISNTVSSGSVAYGISVANGSNNVAVTRNTILRTVAYLSAFGIIAFTNASTAQISFFDNVISQGSSTLGGASGIQKIGFIHPLTCSNNVINGFETPTSGCTAEQGTFPPP